MNYLTLSDMIRVMPRYYYAIFYALWAFALFHASPPSEVYTLKSQLAFMAISVVFAFAIGFIFGTRMKTCPY
jgi:hypothetical protein